MGCRIMQVAPFLHMTLLTSRFYVKSRLNFNDSKHELINPRKVTLKQIQNVLNNPPVKPKSEIKWNETFNTDLE